MTREEAISVLRDMRILAALPKRIEALSMAISALMYDGPKYILLNTPPADAQTIDTGIDALREQESLEKTAKASDEKQATSGWISVKDRRPKHKTRVLFVDVRGCVFLAIDNTDWDDDRVSFLEPASGLWVQGSHWMPLPEPPEVKV